MKKILLFILLSTSWQNPTLASYSFNQLVDASSIFALGMCYVNRGALPKFKFVRFTHKRLVDKGIPTDIIQDKNVTNAAGFLYRNMGPGGGSSSDQMVKAKSCQKDLMRVINDIKLFEQYSDILFFNK